MPLSELQAAVLRLLAAHRNPESDVARAAVLNVEGPRVSEDIDIFHDREEAVARSADADAAVLSAYGFSIRWIRREPGIHVAIIERPTGQEGLLFLKDGVPIQPEPVKLSDYIAHSGQRRGHWPSSSEIGSAMLDREEQ